MKSKVSALNKTRRIYATKVRESTTNVPASTLANSSDELDGPIV